MNRGYIMLTKFQYYREFILSTQDITLVTDKINYIEKNCLTKSYNHNLMHKYITGFGWYGNLCALRQYNYISHDLATQIYDTIIFFSHLKEGQIISIKKWNYHMNNLSIIRKFFVTDNSALTNK